MGSRVMSISYTWSVSQMVCLPENQQVVTVFYTVSGTDGQKTAERSNVVGVAFDPNDTFVPYAQVTPEMAIGWAKANLGADAASSIENDIAQDIANQETPPVVILPLPWASQTQTES